MENIGIYIRTCNMPFLCNSVALKLATRFSSTLLERKLQYVNYEKNRSYRLFQGR